jgi:hypothetical protein
MFGASGPVVQTGHREGSLPLVRAGDILVDRQDQIEEPTKEEIAISVDRISGERPRLDTVRDPTRDVVLAPHVLGDKPAIGFRITRPVRVRPNLRQPVDRRPIGRMALNQLVQDALIDLPPSRRLAGHQ